MNKRNRTSSKHTHRKITLSRRRMTFFYGHTPTRIHDKSKHLWQCLKPV